jgi:hypothetical protein
MLPGATYYITPMGNDMNSGSLSQPWATYPKAASGVVAGDTVLVQPGIYTSQANTNGGNNSLALTTGGNAGSPITFRANGSVTNHFAFEPRANYYVFDGFTWSGDNAGGVSIVRGSGHVIVTNCTFQDGQGIAVGMQNPLDYDRRPETSPGTNVVIDCVFNHLTNGGCITLFGVGNLVQGCLFENGGSQDSIYPMGSNSVIRQCVFTNMSFADGMPNHPDILQVFGDMGFWSVGILFEQNYVVNCPIQLMDFSMKSTSTTIAPTNNYLWGITLRNNVFEDSNMQCSIDTPNARFYNNTFRRCSNGGALLAFAFYDPTWTPYRGWGTGGAVVNNAFVDCSGSYAVVSVGPSQGALTNGSAVVLGKASIWLDSGVFYIWGSYSNLAGTIVSGTLSCGAGDLYMIDPTNFVNGAFSVAIPHTDPAGSVSYDDQQGYYINNGMIFRINTTTVPAGEIRAPLTAYVADTSSVTSSSDYNYNGSAAEPHGLQGTASTLAGTNGCPATLAAPMPGSVLIDSGADLRSLGVTSDFLGTARPQGNGFDIGAFESTGQSSGVPPAIRAQPQGLTATVGSTAAFSVAAAGTAPLSYQWSLNGINLPGVAASSHTDSDVQASDAGDYSVVVVNPYGSVTSAVATLTVLNPAPVPPSITTQPQSVFTSIDASVSFSVSANGSAPLGFQWRFNGISIAGATVSNLTKSNAQTNDAGNYSVVVSNSAGTAVSANALLTVNSSTTAGSDPALVLRFDFDEDFSNGRIFDVSGNGNHGWRMDPTNWITGTSGVFGSSAANFAYVGQFTNNPPNAPYSQYIAVTNCAGFSYLTNGTLSMWAKIDANGDLVMELMDTGSAGVSNTWTLGRDSTFDFTFTTYSDGSSREVLLFPVDVVQYGGSNPDLSTTQFHLYSVTIDCPGNQAIAYYDGQPYMTNTIGLPWLRVNGWLCVGAMQHGGTPQWGDDLYPNAGFFVGKMDDIRIYNRTLSATEVQDLYTGTPSQVRPSRPKGLRIIIAGP